MTHTPKQTRPRHDVRVVVSLPPDLAQRFKALAARDLTTMSALTRQLILAHMRQVDDIQASDTYFECMAAERQAREERLAEKRRLSRTMDMQKMFADLMRYDPHYIVAEAARDERYHGHDWYNLASIPTYIAVLETLHRLAIETTGYRGPQDNDDPDAVRVHAAQEARARRHATRAHDKAEAGRAYRAEAVAREMADPRIPTSHKTKVAAGEAVPVHVTEEGKFALDVDLVLAATLSTVEDHRAVRPMLKLYGTLTFGGSPIETDWITALPKDILIPFIDAAPGYITFLQEVQRLAERGRGTPALRVVS